MSEKVKEVVTDEVERVKELSRQAARSGAYLYPLKGIAYYASHRELWQPLMSRLLPTITLSIGVVAFMFIFTYLPQAAILSIFNGPLAIFTTVLLILSESSAIINILSKSFLLDEALLDTFDGTLVCRNMTDFVAEGRQINRGSSNPIGKLGKAVKKPFERFTPQAIIRYVMYLPLNFIPVVGTALFITMQGRKTGPNAHNRYFQLKHMTPAQREAWINERMPAYTSFGVVALLFELIPVAGIFFAFTNTVGAALWASDLERSGTTAPKLKEEASKVE